MENTRRIPGRILIGEFVVVIATTLVMLLSFEQRGQSQNEQHNKVLDSVFVLLDSMMQINLSNQVNGEEKNLEWGTVYGNLESYFLAEGFLKTVSKEGYGQFFKDQVFSDKPMDLTGLNQVVPDIHHYDLNSPGYIWLSIGHFDYLSKKYDSLLPTEDRFENLVNALSDFYVTYGDTVLSDSELGDSVVQLLSNYDSGYFENRLSLRVFFLNLAYATILDRP